MPQWGVTRRSPVSAHEVAEHAFRVRDDTVAEIGGFRLSKLPAAMRQKLPHQGHGSSAAMVAPHLTAGGAGIVVLSWGK